MPLIFEVITNGNARYKHNDLECSIDDKQISTIILIL